MRDRLTLFFTSRIGIILAGALIGLTAALLQKLGNPPNMGICVACFERDIAGALGLHRLDVVQYLRPEIPALLMGGTLAALLFGEFRARAGGAPVLRFLLGIFSMIGALVFLGCPWRALFRLGGGDLSALVGIAGLLAGIGGGALFVRSGFSLGGSKPGPRVLAWLMPGLMLGLLLLALAEPSFLSRSERGPGAMAAPVGFAVLGGILVGFLAQRTRFCTVGLLRNAVFARDFHLLLGGLALLITLLIANLTLGQFKLGVAAMPIAHSAHLWNFLGMVLAGLAFNLADGCPGRQLVLAGEGSGDAGIFVLGMITGGGIAHNFLLAAKPDKVVDGMLVVGGPGANGQLAVAVGLLFCIVIGFALREREVRA
jgi:uncharacterized protein